MKRIAFVLCFAVSVTLPAISEAANPVANGVCGKAGATQIYQNKKFTCIKSGKKLAWNNGYVIKSIVPTPTPTPTKSPSPTVKPIDPAHINFQLISRASYELVRSNWPTKASNISIQYHYTDNFPSEFLKPWKSQVESSVAYFNKFIDTPQVFNVYFVTELDKSWMDSQGLWNEENLPTFFKYWNNGTDTNNCEGAAAWYVKGPGDPTPSLHGGIAISSKSQRSNMLLWCEHIISHEMFHAVQDYWLTLKQGNVGFPSRDIYDQVEMPIFREGSADTIATAIGQPTYENYFAAFKQRFGELLKGPVPELAKLKTETEVVAYLERCELRSGFSEAHEASYFMGMMLFEYAIYKYGMDKYSELLKAQNKNSKFRDVFAATYGFQIDEMYRQASSHILDGIKVLTQS